MFFALLKKKTRFYLEIKEKVVSLHHNIAGWSSR